MLRTFPFLISALAACTPVPSAADCTAMAPDAPLLAATGQTDAFGDVVVIGTITSTDLQPRRDPPIGTFELAVDSVLRGQAEADESVYMELEDGLSLTIEADHRYVVTGARQVDGRIRVVGCSGVAGTRQIDRAEEAELKLSADGVGPPD